MPSSCIILSTDSENGHERLQKRPWSTEVEPKTPEREKKNEQKSNKKLTKKFGAEKKCKNPVGDQKLTQQGFDTEPLDLLRLTKREFDEEPLGPLTDSS